MRDAMWIVGVVLLCGCNGDVGGAGPDPGGASDVDRLRPVDRGDRPSLAGPAIAPTDDPGGAPYPIVLLHGMFGFNQIDFVHITYFNGVAETLAKAGETQVFTPLVPMLASSEERAAILAPQIDAILARTGKRKVNLIGHSQGGLDARYLVSSLGYADRVASVTTVSTPHHGSRIADVVLAAPASALDLMNPLLQLYGLLAGQKDAPELHASLVSLSQTYCDHVFNPQNPDSPWVSYFSWAGRSMSAAGGTACDGAVEANQPGKLDVATPLLWPMGSFLSLDDTAHPVNDGLVPVESAKHGLFMGCVPADHMKEIGQIGLSGPDLITGFDQRQFYLHIVEDLRSRGF